MSESKTPDGAPITMAASGRKPHPFGPQIAANTPADEAPC